MALSRSLGKLNPKTSILFLCDMQEKFRPTISFYPQIIETANRILTGVQLLDIPVIATEQYPKGLGPTASELDISKATLIQKTQFSMMVPGVIEELKKIPERKSIILCGIEAHVCVQNTVLDLVEQNYDVHVVVDACSSRSMVDRMYSFQRMHDVGAFLTTSESVLLTLVGGSSHPQFKPIQKIIWDAAPDSGLLNMFPANSPAKM